MSTLHTGPSEESAGNSETIQITPADPSRTGGYALLNALRIAGVESSSGCGKKWRLSVFEKPSACRFHGFHAPALSALRCCVHRRLALYSGACLADGLGFIMLAPTAERR